LEAPDPQYLGKLLMKKLVIVVRAKSEKYIRHISAKVPPTMVAPVEAAKPWINLQMITVAIFRARAIGRKNMQKKAQVT
jgi:hypothetical protein